MRFLYFGLFIFAACFPCFSSGRTPEEVLHFNPMINSNSLPSNEVRNLYQDKEGYLWIATYNGLVRYDGYSIVNYKFDIDNKKQNLNSFVNVVTEDEAHNLWIGTQNGLNVFNKITGEMKQVTFPVLENSSIEAIVPARSGDIWIGGNNGLFRRQAGTEEYVFYDMRTVTGKKGTLDIKSMIEDDKGHIWIGTWQQGLFRYDPDRKRFFSYPDLNPRNSSHVIFQDSEHRIWIGTWGYGLTRLTDPYNMEKFAPVLYTHSNTDAHSLLDNIVYAIAQDRNTGKIWVGSRSGLSILNQADNPSSFTNYTPENEKDKLPFNEVNSIICTNDRLMWLGMLGGGVCMVNTHRTPFRLDPLETVQKRYLTSSVRCIYQDDHEKFWLGIMGFGLIYYDRKTKTFIHYTEHPVLKILPYTSTVNAIIRRKTGEYCFGTWDNGVWFYDEKQPKAHGINASNRPEFIDECVYSLLEDSGENLWIGTRSGIYLFDTIWKLYPLQKILDTGEPPATRSSVFSMVEDKEGYIWAATKYDGIMRIDNSSFSKKIKYYSVRNGLLGTGSVLSLCVDSSGRLWAGTNGDGLYRYDRKNDRFCSVNSYDGLSDDVISNILEDDDHSLWLTTNSRLHHILPAAGLAKSEVSSYTISDGLQDYFFNRNACYKAGNGELFFCGYRGINSFFPDQLRQSAVPSPIVITDFKIHNTSLRNFPFSKRIKITDTEIDFMKKAVLSHNENNFSIDFSILNYLNPGLNKYAYKLDGYDQKWIYTDAQRHFAYYNNLKSGNYTFHVKGANENGIWNPSERILKITVLPPPWFSGWAYCGYVFLVVLTGYYTYRIIRNRIRMKQAIALGEVKRQKLEEINHAKLKFFTSITHELMTPLTLISASVDDLKQTYPEQASAYAVISNNTQRLIRLIQQILEFRKIENGKQKLRVSEGNLTKFLDTCVHAFLPLVKKKTLSIRFEHDEYDVHGYFDPDKLDKIIYNLLSNATKYTPESGKISVRLANDPETDSVKISVTNSGEPMTKDKMAHIFERFYEGDHRKFHTIGSGIGLSLVKDLVTLHHGEVSVTSEAGTGNTFTIRISLSRRTYKEEETDSTPRLPELPALMLPAEEYGAEENETADESIPATGASSRLLVVEDNEELRKLMVRLLSQHYRILTAPNGKEALTVLEKEEIDLVISDIMMPEMDGIELCRFIKNKFEYCHIPVILLTAKRSEEDIVIGYESGADGYVCKPLQLALLHAKIDNLLKKKKRMGIDFRKQIVFEAKELNYTSMDEAFIKKAVECVNRHLSDYKFDQTRFIAEMGTSRTTLADKLKSLTGLTPSMFICNIRLKAACQLISEKKKLRINDLAYAVGFNDPKYFSTCFKKKFGLSPSEYKVKYEAGDFAVTDKS